MAAHDTHLTLAPPPASPTPIGRDAGGVPLVDLLRSGLIRLGQAAPADDARPAAAA